MPVLDTTFLIDLDRRDPAALKAFDSLCGSGDRLLVPAQVAIEYLAGSAAPLIAWNDLDRSFHLAEVGKNEVFESARLGRLAKDRGLRPRWADAQIASVAMLNATYVVTANPRDFRALDVPTWDYRREEAPGAAA